MGKLQINGTISSSGTVQSGNGMLIMGSTGSISTNFSTTGGWERGWYFNINNMQAAFGMYGGTSAINYFYVGSYTAPWMKVTPEGTVTATKFVGSLDGNASTASKLSAARTFTMGNSSKSFDGSGNVSWTLAEMGASDRNLLLGNSKEIWIDGDANTYYPVYVNMGHGGILFGWETLSISRRYNDSAPNSWNTSTHRGGLTFTLRWSGDQGWGGNDHNIMVEEFSETYSTMVGGMTLSVDGLMVWLRGGGARYYLSSPYGLAAYATVYYDGYTAGDGRTYSARSYNADTVASEIHSRWLVRPWGIFAGTASNADTIDGHHFNWDGKGGQPTWLWGANEYGNSYVYNPSNFSVNYANSAGSAGSSTTTSYPAGFVQRASTSSWGAVQSGLITEWDVGPNSNKGAVAFLAYPSANEVSVKIDGYFFQNEGNNRVLDNGDIAVSSAAAHLTASGWYKVATVSKRENNNTYPLSVLLVLGKNYSYSNSDMFTILIQGGYYNSQFIPIGHCDNGIDAYTQIRSTGDGANGSFDIEVYVNTPSGGNHFCVKAVAIEGSVTCHAFTAPSGSVMKSQSIQFTTHGGSYGSTDPASNPSAIPGYGEAGAIYYKI